MTRPVAGPLTRLIDVERARGDRSEITVEASAQECTALAAEWGIPGIRDLVGRFRLQGSLARLHVGGTVEAVVTQICSVSLEPFESVVREPVDVDFTDRDSLAAAGADEDAVADLPDPIVNGRIDFGALTAEFLALGLDPYPRKPGLSFEPVAVGDDEGPLAALRKLVPRNDG